MDRHGEERVVLRRTTVVQVLSPGSSHTSGRSQEGKKVEMHYCSMQRSAQLVVLLLLAWPARLGRSQTFIDELE